MIYEWLAALWHLIDGELRDHRWVWWVRGEIPNQYLECECRNCGIVEGRDWDTRLFGGCPGGRGLLHKGTERQDKGVCA